MKSVTQKNINIFGRKCGMYFSDWLSYCLSKTVFWGSDIFDFGPKSQK